MTTSFFKKLGIFLCLAGSLIANSHVEQLVHMQVDDIRDISFDSTYLDFDLNSSTAGVLDPVTVMTTYDIVSTSAQTLAIYAKLDINPFLNNLRIFLLLDAPNGAVISGPVLLSTTFQKAVDSIEDVSAANLFEYVTVAPLGGAAVPSEGSYVYTLEFILAEA
ncbi:MAG: hypothetical protein MRY21_02860 [Simkaniaceae bacterium]|nr:hypothetical protein [Simkaniaceae bacterium]